MAAFDGGLFLAYVLKIQWVKNKFCAARYIASDVGGVFFGWLKRSEYCNASSHDLVNIFSLAVSPLDYWNTFCHLTVKSWTLAGVDLQTNIKWSEMKMKKKRKWWLKRRRPNGRYQLLLTRHKSLKTRGHTKSQLVNEGRLILAVDLNLDACFVGGLICGYSRPSNGTVDASGNLPYGDNAQSQVLVKPVLEAYQWRHTHVLVG